MRLKKNHRSPDAVNQMKTEQDEELTKRDSSREDQQLAPRDLLPSNGGYVGRKKNISPVYNANIPPKRTSLGTQMKVRQSNYY